MRQERLEILTETVNSLNNHFKFSQLSAVIVDHNGMVMKGSCDPDKLSRCLDELVTNQGFSKVTGELAEVFKKDITTVGSIVVTRRFDRDNMVTLGVTV